MDYADLYYLAHCDHLHNDDQPRSVPDILFAAYGYAPRDPNDVHLPLENQT